jgi:hypothetical protein
MTLVGFDGGPARRSARTLLLNQRDPLAAGWWKRARGHQIDDGPASTQVEIFCVRRDQGPTRPPSGTALDSSTRTSRITRDEPSRRRSEEGAQDAGRGPSWSSRPIMTFKSRSSRSIAVWTVRIYRTRRKSCMCLRGGSRHSRWPGWRPANVSWRRAQPTKKLARDTHSPACLDRRHSMPFSHLGLMNGTACAAVWKV